MLILTIHNLIICPEIPVQVYTCTASFNLAEPTHWALTARRESVNFQFTNFTPATPPASLPLRYNFSPQFRFFSHINNLHAQLFFSPSLSSPHPRSAVSASLLSCWCWPPRKMVAIIILPVFKTQLSSFRPSFGAFWNVLEGYL